MRTSPRLLQRTSAASLLAVAIAATAGAQSTVDLALADSSALESAGSHQIEVLLDVPSAADVEVHFTALGSALVGTDLTVAASPLVIPAGSTSGFIDLSLIDDVDVEGRETLVVTLGAPVGGTLGALTAHSFTLEDDEPAATAEFLLASSSSGEGAGPVDILVQLSSALTEDTAIPFSLAGDATVGVDYTATASPLIVPGGATSAAITITPIDDASDETDEIVQVDLGVPDNAVLGAAVQHQLTVVDDDLPPAVAFGPNVGYVAENGGPLAVTVELTEVSAFDVTVPVTATGNAVAGVHYTLMGAPLVISAGSLSGDLVFQPIDNVGVSGERLATLNLGAPTNGTLGVPSSLDVRILDDDLVPEVKFNDTVSSFLEDEGVVQVDLRLSSSPAEDIVLPFTVGGTAVDPDDYTLSPSPLVIPAGSLSGELELTIVDDSATESTETVDLSLGTPTGAALGAVTQHTLSIVDNDTTLTAEFALATDAASEGAGQVMVEVSLSGTAGSQVSIPFTYGGSASDPEDYTPAPGPLVIAQGASSGFLLIDLVSDALYEGGDEDIVITMGTPTGADLGNRVVHTLTITEDDPLPAASFAVFRTIVEELSGGFTVRLELDAVSGVDATIPFSITGPASGPGDIIAPTNPVVVPAGQTFVDIAVGLVVDRVGEAGETVTFTLDQPMTHAQPGAIASHLVAIIDGNAASQMLPPALVATPQALDFGYSVVGAPGSTQQVIISNQHVAPITFLGLELESGATGSYAISYPTQAPPVTLAPAQSVTVDVDFLPVAPGPRNATLRVRQNFGGIPPSRIDVTGRAIGAPGFEVVMNAGEAAYLSASRVYWSADFGSSGSEGLISSSAAVQGTTDDPLYQTSRWGTDFSYAFPVQNGRYDVRFHSWEPVQISGGTRVFDILAEGQTLIDDLDLFAEVGTRTAWASPTFTVDVVDGQLDLEFDASVNRALISAIEIRSFPIESTTTPFLYFGTVDQGSFGQLDVELVNSGLAPSELISVQIIPGSSGSASEFSVDVGGQMYFGGPNSSNFAVSMPIAPGQSELVPVFFTPTLHRDNDLELIFNFASGEALTVDVEGTGGANQGWGFLHPVLDLNPLVVIDYDGDGQESVALLGNESHTHEPGHSLSAFEWTVNSTPVASTMDTVQSIPLGSNTVGLTIWDDNVPPASATDTMEVPVYAADAVPGILVEIYDGSILGELFLLDNVPASPDHVGRQATLFTGQNGSRIGRSNLSGQAMVQWTGEFDLANAATLEFVPTGGVDDRLFVDQMPVAGPLALSAGSHTLVVRFAVTTLGDLPLELQVLEGGAPVANFEATLTHDESALVPVIHSMPTQGTDLGGNDIVIEGFGFYPRDQVVVDWGGTPIDHNQFVEYTPERIEFLSPPGSGSIPVKVVTPQGVSNVVTFNYSPSGPVPVRWLVHSDRQLTLTDPVRGTWGPDGRLWVAMIDGSLRAISYDDEYHVTNVQFYPGVSGLTNKDPLGIAFNPFDVYSPGNASSLRIYVAHGELFQNGGLSFTGPSDFTGEVSVLHGPNFDAPTPLITNLPVSNHDHSVNGLEFDANGDLLIACGGNTNAGIQWPLIGDVPESALSGAILKAFTSRSPFHGTIQYVDRVTGATITDQVLGDLTRVAGTADIEVYAPGFRNPFDLVLHSNGNIYATDNGPNDPYGPESLGPNVVGGNPHPAHPDEIMLVERGNYYGHPNPTRALDDEREFYYHNHLAPSVAHEFTQSLRSVDSSTNGIEEYRATAFNSRIRGDLVAMKWNGGIRIYDLAPSGREILSQSIQQPSNPGLDVAVAPGGALVAIDYSSNRIRVQVPDDVAAVGLTAYDVFPNRAPVSGGMPFVLGGVGFGTVGSTTVTFDGVPAVLTSVTSKRIRGIVPASISGATGAVDVVVSVGANSSTLVGAFRYLPATPGLALGRWTEGGTLPVALGEVACAELGGTLYVFGQGDSRTFAYDLLSGTWSSSLAQRPFAGNHHGCEVFDDKLYLIGGLDSSSPGTVQIYDPTTDSWTTGATMPWSGGSLVTGLIDGKIYAGGGIVGSSTVANFAVYDPALDTWTARAPMPLGVNHAAAATDGDRLFVFGGRQGPNVPQPGFSNVQVYDPVTNTWQTSAAGSVAPMPLPRGGTGKAVWYRGEFYVFGGEDTSNAFGEVQAYDPMNNTWRQEADMPTPRHGIFPVLFQDRVFVVGGGLVAGFGMSNVIEVFKRP